jgi:hypothetical protein
MLIVLWPNTFPIDKMSTPAIAMKDASGMVAIQEREGGNYLTSSWTKDGVRRREDR